MNPDLAPPTPPVCPAPPSHDTPLLIPSGRAVPHSPVMPGVQRFVFSGAALTLGITGLHFGQAVLMPVALAALLAFALAPGVSWLQRRRLPPAVAVGMVMALAVTGLLGGGVLATLQVGELGQELPTHRQNIQKKLRDLRPALSPSGTTREVTRLMDMVGQELETASRAYTPGNDLPARVQPVALETRSSTQRAVDFALSVGVQLATVALVLILVTLMLHQRADLVDRFLRLMGGDTPRMAAALAESGRRVSRFMIAQVLVNLGFGVPLAVGLWLIGVPGAWLWGALATVLRFVPYLGPALSAVCPVVLAFAVDPGWHMVLWTLGLILSLELVNNNLVEPLAYGSSTGLSPLAVVLSAAFWALLWGPVGLVLATPLTVCLVVMGRQLTPLRFLDVLFSSDPVRPAGRP